MMGHKLTCHRAAICPCAAGCAAGAASKEHKRLLQLAGATECMPGVTSVNLTSYAIMAAGSAGAAVLILRQPCLQCVGQQSIARAVKLLLVSVWANKSAHSKQRRMYSVDPGRTTAGYHFSTMLNDVGESRKHLSIARLYLHAGYEPAARVSNQPHHVLGQPGRLRQVLHHRGRRAERLRGASSRRTPAWSNQLHLCQRALVASLAMANTLSKVIGTTMTCRLVIFSSR